MWKGGCYVEGRPRGAIVCTHLTVMLIPKVSQYFAARVNPRMGVAF